MLSAEKSVAYTEIPVFVRRQSASVFLLTYILPGQGSLPNSSQKRFCPP